MKRGIHPKYETIKVNCSCGNKFEVRSTYAGSLQLDVCAKCHPFYTGQQKIIDTAGRVESFKQKYAFLSSAKPKSSANSDQAAG